MAGQFHLQLAFMTSGPLPKNLKDQEGPVVHGQLKMSLKIALLSRTQALVEQNFNRAQLSCHQFDFIGLTAANKKGCVWRLAFAGQACNRFEARCLCQQAQLIELTIEIR